MTYAVIWVPGFGLHAILRGEAGLAGRPLALVAGEGKRAKIVAASAEAAGVELDMTPSLAMARCPGLVFRAPDDGLEKAAQRLLVAAAFGLAPRVEDTGPGECTVDLRGSGRSETERAMGRIASDLAGVGLPAQIGAAQSPGVAALAARRAAPVLVVESAANFLAPLPLAAAAPAAGIADILAQWGIATLGQLAALAKGEVGCRLGPEGAALWERAVGRSERVLRLVEPERTFEAEWQYEPPVEAMEPLLFRLRRYAETVAWELRARHLVASQLALTLRLEDEATYERTFRMPEPTADPGLWLRVFHAHLETVRTGARVSGVRLKAEPARAPEKQDGLFDTGLVDRALFWENLAKVAAVVGDGSLGTPALRNTHRPDGFILEPPAETIPPPSDDPIHPPRGPVLRRLRPPWPVWVTLEEGRPVRIQGEFLAGAINGARGPWCSSGEWWVPARWAVETWQVELGGGGLYQLARSKNAWVVDGIWD